MSLLTKESDLLLFINQKKQKKIDVSYRKIFDMFSKLITTAMLETFNKLSLSKYVISCTESVKNLFWFLITYTNNLKLTMFLSERAVLLFNEYIVMTKNTVIGNNNYNSVNLTEIKNFVYKKTVGPIQIGHLSNSNQVPVNLISGCNVLYQIYVEILIRLTKHNDDQYNLVKIEKQLSDIFTQAETHLAPLVYRNVGPNTQPLVELLSEYFSTDLIHSRSSAVSLCNSITVLIWWWNHLLSQVSDDSLVTSQATLNKTKMTLRRQFTTIAEVCHTKLHKTFLHDVKQLNEWFQLD